MKNLIGNKNKKKIYLVLIFSIAILASGCSTGNHGATQHAQAQTKPTQSTTKTTSRSKDNTMVEGSFAIYEEKKKKTRKKLLVILEKVQIAAEPTVCVAVI